MNHALKNILLVEDETLIAMMQKRQLEQKGYCVVHVPSGEKAIELVNAGSQPVDVILMDIDLGKGMDGTAAASEILRSHDLPVIFVSSHTETQVVEKTEAITNYGYVVKNSSITVLDASIKMAFKLFEAHRSINQQKMEIEAAYEEMQVSNEDLLQTQQDLVNHGLELHDSEERYRLLFTSMLEGFALHEIICDGDGAPVDYRFVDMNPAFERLTGLRREDTVGRTALELMPETEQYWIQNYGRVALTGESISFENFSVALRRFYQVVAFCPKKGFFAVLFSDITERRAAEDSLRKERSKLDMIMETSPIGIATVDASGAITYANRMAEKILGLARKDITSRDYNAPAWNSTGLDGKPFPDENQPFFVVKSTLRSAYDIKHAIVWPDGRRVVLSVNASPLLDEAGKFLGMIATFDDITERQHAEARIEKLLKEKDAILKEVHHRVKNNMNIMCSLLGMQSDAAADAGTKDILHDAVGRLQSMMVLYDRLYRSDDAGSMPVGGYLSALIDEIVAIFPRRQAISVQTDLGDFSLDSRLLSTLGIIINELASNSMKYAFADRSTGTLSVSASMHGGRVTVAYGDDGIGLPDSVSFERSTGFGMRLVRLLVEQLDGEVEIHRDKGTRYVIGFDAGRD